MFRSLLLSLLGLSALSCSDLDAAPLFVDIQYQVRCVNCQPIADHDEPRNITVLDGEAGFTVRCRYFRKDGDRIVTFSSQFMDEEGTSNNYSVEIREANMDAFDPGSACEVSVTEGANEYLGKCTSRRPNEATPCRLEFEFEAGIITGSLLCMDVTNRANMQTSRHVTKPGEDDEAAPFEIHGCVDLDL